MHLLGQHNVTLFGNLRIWPENGLIKIEDKRDGSYEAITVKEALLRAKALNDMVKNSGAHIRNRTKDAAYYSDEIKTIQDLVESVVNACRIAREQGMPDDPVSRQERINRRPKMVPVSSGVKIKPTPAMLGAFD